MCQWFYFRRKRGKLPQALVVKIKPETVRPSINKGLAQSRYCCNSMAVVYISGEIPIKLRDSWFLTKYVYA